MYKIVDKNGTIYSEYQYENEAEYERLIVENAEIIFGSQGIYFDIKKMIGKPKELFILSPILIFILLYFYIIL